MMMKASILIAFTILIPLSLSQCKKSEIAPAANSSQNSSGVKDGIITTVVGQKTSTAYTADGSVGIKTSIGYLTAVAVDASDNLFFTDAAANIIRKVDHQSQLVSTVGGIFLGFNVADPTPSSGDGNLATKAHLNIPYGLTVGPSGNIYIADAGNDRIRKINFATGLMSTVAGGFFSTTAPTNFGDGGLATGAILWNPEDVAVDDQENLWIADMQNNSVRMVTAASGIITTIAGQGPSVAGYGGDGGLAASCKLNSPGGLAVDADGNIYIADTGNHVIRMINGRTRMTNTIAGTPTMRGYTGDGGSATSSTLNSPTGIAVDAAGNIFIADNGNNVVREIIAATGQIVTVAGTGKFGYSGDGGASTSAKLANPLRVAVDSKGVLYIADSQNSVIRAVAF